MPRRSATSSGGSTRAAETRPAVHLAPLHQGQLGSHVLERRRGDGVRIAIPHGQIGVLAPLAVPFWIGASALTRLSLKSHRHVGPALETVPTTPFVAAAESGRLRRGLLVYDGGRT